MKKKFASFLAAALMAISLQAQQQAQPAQQSQPADTLAASQVVTVADSVGAQQFTTIEVSDAMVDEVYRKISAKLEDEAFWNASADDSKDPFGDIFYQESAAMVIGVVAIIFGVPCFTILTIIIIIFSFFFRKNRTRNAIISKAIEDGYQLPDAFFSGQSAPTYIYNTYTTDGTCAAPDAQRDCSPQPECPPQQMQGAWQQQPAPSGPQIPAGRDPKKFSSAVMLIAVGAALMIAFLAIRNPFMAFVAGGIPLLLGVGKMVGYYFIPGYNSRNLDNKNFISREMKDCGPMRDQQPPYGYGQPPYGYNQPPYGQQPPYNNGQPHYNNGTLYNNGAPYNNNGAPVPPNIPDIPSDCPDGRR